MLYAMDATAVIFVVVPFLLLVLIRTVEVSSTHVWLETVDHSELLERIPLLTSILFKPHQ